MLAPGLVPGLVLAPRLVAGPTAHDPKGACEYWEKFLAEKITTECAPPGNTWRPAC